MMLHTYFRYSDWGPYIEGLAQDCPNSISNAQMLQQSCPKPKIYSQCLKTKPGSFALKTQPNLTGKCTKEETNIFLDFVHKAFAL